MPLPIAPVLAGILALTVGDAEMRPPDPAAKATPAPKPCAAPEYRQFDFWLGEWNVTNPAGKVAGESRITRILGGCAVREEWTGAGGLTGTSLNMYDSARRRWHQTWVDDKGNVLLLEGAFRGGRMVLEGDAPAESGTLARQRITWSPLSGNRVRQLWESSADSGKTWKTEFDGIYAKKKNAP